MLTIRNPILPVLYGPDDIPFENWLQNYQAQIEEKTTLAEFSKELKRTALYVALAYDRKDQDYLCFLVGDNSSFEKECIRFPHECDCGLLVTMVCFTLDYHFVVSF